MPVVTKNQQNNLPHVLIDAKVPSGVVDTMEYWITYDTTQGNDALRNYVKIGTMNNTVGDAYVENTHVIYRHNNLSKGDFYVMVLS